MKITIQTQETLKQISKVRILIFLNKLGAFSLSDLRVKFVIFSLYFHLPPGENNTKCEALTPRHCRSSFHSVFPWPWDFPTHFQEWTALEGNLVALMVPGIYSLSRSNLSLKFPCSNTWGFWILSFSAFKPPGFAAIFLPCYGFLQLDSLEPALC